MNAFDPGPELWSKVERDHIADFGKKMLEADYI